MWPRGHALVLALFLSCARSPGSHGDPAQDKDAGPDDPVPVEVVTVETGPIEDALRFSANLEAEVQVQVLARAAGQVKALLVEEGDVVSKDQVLLRLEDEEQQSALKRAQTELAQAKRKFEDEKQLHEHGVTSDQLRQAAEFELQRVQIAHDDALRMLRYTVVRASVAGTVTSRNVKLGDFVNPNQHLFDITDFGSIVAKVHVPEKVLASVKPGVAARISTATQGDEFVRQGVVARIAPVVDARSGTAKVTIEIADTEGLKPGAFVSVELVTDANRQAVLLPRRALVYDNDQPYVFKVTKDGRAMRIAVVKTLEDRNHIEPASGFAPGDRVVVAGQIGLKDHAKVEVREAPAPKP